MRIVHTRSRYIYDLYYNREGISKELYDWLLTEGYADSKFVLYDSVAPLVRSSKVGSGQSNCEMEEEWVRKVVLREVHSEQGSSTCFWLGRACLAELCSVNRI